MKKKRLSKYLTLQQSLFNQAFLELPVDFVRNHWLAVCTATISSGHWRNDPRTPASSIFSKHMIYLLYSQKRKDEKRYLDWNPTNKSWNEPKTQIQSFRLSTWESHPTMWFFSSCRHPARTHEDKRHHKVMCYNCTEPPGGVPRTLKHLRNPGKIISMALMHRCETMI